MTIRRTTGTVERRFIDLSVDLQGLIIDLEPPATIAGVVIDAVTGQPIVNASLTAGDPAALAGPAAHESKFLPAIAGYTFSTAGGDFKLEIGPNASQLLVVRHGYANAVLPLIVLPGQRLTGLVVELQPRPSETPSQ